MQEGAVVVVARARGEARSAEVVIGPQRPAAGHGGSEFFRPREFA